MDLKDYIEYKWDKSILSLRIIPNAKKTMIAWIMWDGNLKIRINSIPENWKANKELILFISKELNIKKSQIEIIYGLTSQNKIVKIDF
jgi:hypothetical protein